jgi:PAS domain-containing protein
MNRSTIRTFGRRAILPSLLIFCTLFYYFGELVDLAGWDALRWNFFYGVHDVHRLLFLMPIIYAGYTARMKGALIVTLGAFAVFLPRAFLISPYPDPLLRMVLFTIIAGVIGSLIGVIRNRSERCQQLEAMIRKERDILLNVVDELTDGVIVIGPDYRIRLTNPKMVKCLGDGTGSLCYKYLHNRDAPCQDGCQMLSIIKSNKIAKWEYRFSNGKTCEVIASPYIDADGVICQLTILHNFQPAQKV